MTEESAVKVCVRVRPLIAREESASENAEPVQIFWKADEKSIHQIDDGNSTKSFSFDRVFAADETTSQLYNGIAKPLVVSTVEGYNGTIFAYGQTSSGKTFTMMGTSRTPGVIPQAVEDVFQSIKNFPKKEFLLRVSYMEIYNETVTDLLVDSWKRKPLEVREQINKNIYVADLTEELVTSPAQVLAWIRKGEKNRHYGKTKMNQRSSRSHTIFRMILESRERSDPASGESSDGAIIVSHLNLVDLAGSERASQTGAEGTRFKEGCNINRSLFTLGQVIKKLTDENQKGFTNYRDSKLTRILQNSLGGNAKTVIICTITPVTLDETLSTLQFASTAKKMKNDPHVTEVSDDGALLKRYRNEIAELKRRLHEVSSVTQTTVTEKEVLSQLLQEKDQLQREKEGLKRNLANLLVTSSNLVPVQKIPSRRVTWGGKMVKLGHPSGCVGSFSDLSFAESFTQKRTQSDFSCLMELGEDDEDFESNWGIPDEPSDEMEMSRSSVRSSVRSFGDSPRDFMSPDRLQELSGKVSSLEMQLEQESQEKETALSNLDVLKGRVAELQLELETEVQHRQEALEKVQTGEQRRAALEALLHTEAQQRLEVTQKADTLELRVMDLEKQLGEHSDVDTETNEQMRKEFAETIQLCETLASEKDLVAAERDYLKQELGMFIEQMERLETEKAAVLQELEEKREMDEFKSLEEGCRKENEKELENEIVSLKKAVESSELQRMQLQNEIKTLTEQLKKKETEFAHEMENLGSKDLVQEVLKLRRSLDDAELLSRDTRKEWAVLRSRSISLEETNVTLTASHEKREAEVKSLRFQLETEKSRYRKMQSDLQKELNVAFDENTKLTTLLDGNVPKNLIDSIELERTVANLNKELMASHQVETALRAQLDELAACQTLPDKVDALVKQLEGSEQERGALEGKLSDVQQLIKDLEEKLADSEASRSTEEEISRELQEQISQLNEELRCVRAEKAELLSEQSTADQRFTEETEKLLSAVTSVTAERDELRVKLQEHVDKVAEMQVVLPSVQDELQTQKEKNSDLVKAHEQKESDLGEKMLRLSQELQCVRDEKEALLMTTFQRESEDVEKLSATLASLTAERDQLRTDLQENVEMMIVNQEELRTALGQNGEQKKQIKELEEQILKLDGLPSEHDDKLVELQTHIKALTEELESVRAERDSLLCEKELSTQTSTEEMEKLLCRVTSVSEERDELQEILEGLRQEKQQLQAELEDRVETLQSEVAEMQVVLPSVQDELQTQKEKNSDLVKAHEQKESDLGEKMLRLSQELQCVRDEKEALLMTTFQRESEDVEKLSATLASLTAERDQLRTDLQENVEMMIVNQEELRTALEQNGEQKKQIKELEEQILKLDGLPSEHNDKLVELQRHIKALTEELESVRAERDSLLSEKELSTQTSTEEMEKLLCRVTSVSKERDELQEILEGLRQEKQQLQAELEDRVETLQSEIRTLTDALKMAEAEGARLLSEKELSSQTSTEEMEKLLCRVTSVSEERDELQEILKGLRQEKQQLQAELEDRMQMISAIQDKLSQLEQLNMQQQPERGEQEAKLQQDILQLKEQVQMHTERRAQAESEADAVQQLLSEANATISALREQLSRSEPSTSGAKELLSSQLQDSTTQIEESFKSFQQFIDTCCSYDNITQDRGLRERRSLKHPLPKATKDAYDAVFQLGQSTDDNLRKIQELLRVKALGYRNIFEELVKNDLAVFEERRLQDVLLCRAQAPSHSVQVEGFDTLWEQRLPELLDRRQLYMEKMSSILDKLWDHMTSYLHELKGEIQERFKFNKQLQVLITNQPISFSGLDSILEPESDRRTAEIQSKKCLLQSITDEQKGPFEELKQLEAEAESHLREVKSKSSTLLQALEEGALLTVAALLKETQQLASQLKHAEEKVKALHIQNEQLEEARIKADAKVSNHKEATQLLQTELQDNRALVEEKENAIQALKSKIRESEKKSSPSVAELEKLQTKLLQLEMKLSSASDEHKREIQAMNTLLEEKEELLRKLKETLRKSQQEGEESFLQGKDLHARLTNPRSSVVSSSILMEKSKLEKEVSQLHMKITELESVVASQQAEITKWKNRAIKLKVRNKVEEDKLQSPSTPTKRGFPMTSDSSNLLSSPKKFLIPAKKLLDTPRKGLESPRKLLDSPKASLLESPKSRFFDVGGSSETLSRNCPKQFFDNSSLGTIPEVSRVPETAAPEQDVTVDTDKNEWWPKSPKQEEMCKTQ
ncbi:centromere-associated protein E isoform X6 [Simochromis diagramma]|uniref:centromere-associated protein E isoform X6 n=1 Tax=Simochromis diagramma TaxID=43689 RepID=UPI001A7E51DD|nr:centromere-associated protein E isoform X6 [Simochromis diagramma]